MKLIPGGYEISLDRFSKTQFRCAIITQLWNSTYIDSKIYNKSRFTPNCFLTGAYMSIKKRLPQRNFPLQGTIVWQAQKFFSRKKNVKGIGEGSRGQILDFFCFDVCCNPVYSFQNGLNDL